MVECPADGCDYDGLHDSVLGHYSGKRDGNHPGGYQHAKQLLNDSADDPQSSTQTMADDSPAHDTSTDSDPVDNTQSTNPVMGDANPADDDSSTVELPCGHEEFDPSSVPESAIVVEDGDRYTSAECETCGGSWGVNLDA